MGGQAGEQRPRAFARETRRRECVRRTQRGKTETSQRQRPCRPAQRREQIGHALLPPASQVVHQRAPRRTIAAQSLRRRVERTLEHDRASVQRVRHGRGGMDPRETVFGERQRAQQR